VPVEGCLGKVSFPYLQNYKIVHNCNFLDFQQLTESERFSKVVQELKDHESVCKSLTGEFQAGYTLQERHVFVLCGEIKLEHVIWSKQEFSTWRGKEGHVLGRLSQLPEDFDFGASLFFAALSAGLLFRPLL
jgi:hypothetical protein